MDTPRPKLELLQDAVYDGMLSSALSPAVAVQYLQLLDHLSDPAIRPTPSSHSNEQENPNLHDNVNSVTDGTPHRSQCTKNDVMTKICSLARTRRFHRNCNLGHGSPFSQGSEQNNRCISTPQQKHKLTMQPLTPATCDISTVAGLSTDSAENSSFNNSEKTTVATCGDASSSKDNDKVPIIGTLENSHMSLTQPNDVMHTTLEGTLLENKTPYHRKLLPKPAAVLNQNFARKSRRSLGNPGLFRVTPIDPEISEFSDEKQGKCEKSGRPTLLRSQSLKELEKIDEKSCHVSRNVDALGLASGAERGHATHGGASVGASKGATSQKNMSTHNSTWDRFWRAGSRRRPSCDHNGSRDTDKSHSQVDNNTKTVKRNSPPVMRRRCSMTRDSRDKLKHSIKTSTIILINKQAHRDSDCHSSGARVDVTSNEVEFTTSRVQERVLAFERLSSVHKSTNDQTHSERHGLSLRPTTSTINPSDQTNPKVPPKLDHKTNLEPGSDSANVTNSTSQGLVSTQAHLEQNNCDQNTRNSNCGLQAANDTRSTGANFELGVHPTPVTESLLSEDTGDSHRGERLDACCEEMDSRDLESQCCCTSTDVNEKTSDNKHGRTFEESDTPKDVGLHSAGSSSGSTSQDLQERASLSSAMGNVAEKSEEFVDENSNCEKDYRATAECKLLRSIEITELEAATVTSSHATEQNASSDHSPGCATEELINDCSRLSQVQQTPSKDSIRAEGGESCVVEETCDSEKRTLEGEKAGSHSYKEDCISHPNRHLTSERCPISSPLVGACKALVCRSPLGTEFKRGFVALPKSAKYFQARLMTFSKPLREKLATMQLKNRNNGGDLDGVITASGLEQPDHAGWLIDQSNQRKVWAVLADMLFCVFDSPKSEKPLLVQVMAGLHVKGIMYNSAKRDILSPSMVGTKSRTISGLCKYQFILDNPCQRTTHVYGVDTKQEMQTWVSFLKVSTTLDMEIFEAETDPSEEQDGEKEGGRKAVWVTKDRCHSNDIGCHGDMMTTKARHPSSSSSSAWSASDDSNSGDVFLDTCDPDPSQNSGKSQNADEAKSKNFRESQVHQSTGKGGLCPTNIVRESRNNPQNSLSRDVETSKKYYSLHGANGSPSPRGDTSINNKPKMALQGAGKTDKPSHSPKILSCTKSAGVPYARSKKLYERSLSCDIGASTLPGRPKIAGLPPRHPKLKLASKSDSFATSTDKDSKHQPLQMSLDDSFIESAEAEQRKALKSSIVRSCSYREVNTIGKDESQAQNQPASLTKTKRFGSFEDLKRKFMPRTRVRSFSGQRKKPEDDETPEKNRLRASSTGAIDKDLEEDGSSKSGLKSKLIRKASNAKDKMFGSKKKQRQSHENAQLENLSDLEMVGCLQHRHFVKWIKIWCAISGGMFYAFRSRNPQAFPMLAMPLNECTLSLVATDKSKKEFVFKLCQLNARSMFFAAIDSQEYSQWLKVMKEYTIFCDKIPADDDLVSPGQSIDSAISGQSGDSSSLHSTGSTRSSTQSSSSNMDTTSLQSYPGVIMTNAQNHSTPCCDYSKLDPSFHWSNSDGGESGFSSWTENYLRSLSVPNHNISTCTTFHGSDVGNVEEVTLEDEADESESGSKDLELDLPNDLESKYVSSPKYDVTLRQVWQSGQSLHNDLLKVKLSTEAAQREGIFNCHLPGPNNEGLLLVRDDGHGDGIATNSQSSEEFDLAKEEKRLIQSRRKSFSDGSLPVPILDHLENYIRTQTQRLTRPVAPSPVPARDLESPTVQGYLERKMSGGDWECTWCVLKGVTLYIYAYPIDEEAFDTIELPGFEIQQVPQDAEGDEDGEQKFVWELSHDCYLPEWYSCETQAELQKWTTHLEAASHKVSLEGLDLDKGCSQELLDEDAKQRAFEEERAESWQKELRNMRKQKLLQEVLRQKEEIMRRHASMKTMQDDSSVQYTMELKRANLPRDLASCRDISVRDITLLKQRRASTRLKADTLRRRLQSQDKKSKKKSRFSLSLKSTKSPSTSPELQSTNDDYLQSQLRDLTDELTLIERDLDLKQMQIISTTCSLSSSKPQDSVTVPKKLFPPQSPDCAAAERSLVSTNQDPLTPGQRSISREHSVVDKTRRMSLSQDYIPSEFDSSDGEKKGAKTKKPFSKFRLGITKNDSVSKLRLKKSSSDAFLKTHLDEGIAMMDPRTDESGVLLRGQKSAIFRSHRLSSPEGTLNSPTFSSLPGTPHSGVWSQSAQSSPTVEKTDCFKMADCAARDTPKQQISPTALQQIEDFERLIQEKLQIYQC